MYKECKEHLITVLKQAGVLREPCTSMRNLKKAADSIRISAVIPEEELLEKDKSKRVYTDAGLTKKRRRIYGREIVFTVIIGEASDAAAEEIYQKFIQGISDGIYVDGNYVELVPERAEWTEEGDSILRSKCTVQLGVRCIGGIYRNTEFMKLKEVGLYAERGSNGSKGGE